MATSSVFAAGPLARLRVLLVEDDDDSREMFAEFFRSFGLEVAQARSGNEALAMFKADPPALLVSDIAMPDGDGISLISSIRALSDEEGGLTPAIAVSAHSDVEAAILAGFNVLLPKPVDPVNLVDVMRNFVEHGTRPGRAAWTVTSPRSGLVVIRYSGRLTARDSEAAIEVLVKHLERGEADVVADLRDLTSFEPAATSRGQRVAWTFRKRVKSLTLVGGSSLARIVSVAAARLMRIPCIVTAEPPEALGGAQA